MDLTVIILNFNVRYLLESCLESVFTATASIPSEVIVVDNASTDESVAMVQTRFPQVMLLTNTENLGFAKANNQAIRRAKGRKILILNPDTLVNKQAIIAGSEYLDHDDSVAAVGVKMTDGNGNFLKESKRGFPTLWSSLWKLTGISRWFPEHKQLNHYYLGHLDQNDTHEVEVLTGAFLMVRKKILDQLGGFDEGYFMYGEDIDLSHRIRQLGYRLVYLGNVSITHLKGRSSKAHSIQHVRNFYLAMLVFVKKYYSHPGTKWLMTITIWLAGIFSWVKRQLFFHFLPLTDLVLMTGTIYLIQLIWSRYWFDDPDYFYHPAFFWNASGYIIIWFVSLFSAGAYRIQRSSPGFIGLQAILSGALVILLLYSLLPETWRTSRAIILLSGFSLAAIIPLSRVLLKPQEFGYRALLFGDEAAEKKLNTLFRSLSFKNFFAYISRLDPGKQTIPFESKLAKLVETIHLQSITHIFLARTPEWKHTLLNLTRSRLGNVIYLLEDQDTDNFTHSGPIPGLTEVSIRLNMPVYKLSKLIVNVFCSILILPWAWVMPEIRHNFIQIVTGKKQWVSYQTPADPALPNQKPGLWHPADHLGSQPIYSFEVNFEYAQHYNPVQDISIILTNLFKIR